MHYNNLNKNINTNNVSNFILNNNNYIGICLFDIDGTLTTGMENEQIVQYFLDLNFAVGICTAGAMYTKENLSSFSWMPINLYNFMYRTNFITFNNIASKYLCGEYNPEVYNEIENKYKSKYNLYLLLGILKGFALIQTKKKLLFNNNYNNNYNYNNFYSLLIDNDPYFLQGSKIFDSSVIIICGGKPCGDFLNLNHIKKYFK